MTELPAGGHHFVDTGEWAIVSNPPLEATCRHTDSEMTIQREHEVRPDSVVIGATNRHELIDDALTILGRLGETIFVPPPGREAQREIFAVHV